MLPGRGGRASRAWGKERVRAGHLLAPGAGTQHVAFLPYPHVISNLNSCPFKNFTLEGGCGREKERERNIDRLPFICALTGDKPTTQACALTGN